MSNNQDIAFTCGGIFILATGVVGAIGHMSNTHNLASWGDATPMSPPTCVALIVVGCLFMLQGYRIKPKP